MKRILRIRKETTRGRLRHLWQRQYTAAARVRPRPFTVDQLYWKGYFISRDARQQRSVAETPGRFMYWYTHFPNTYSNQEPFEEIEVWAGYNIDYVPKGCKSLEEDPYGESFWANFDLAHIEDALAFAMTPIKMHMED